MKFGLHPTGERQSRAAAGGERRTGVESVKVDRRQEKTRRAIHHAFADLVLVRARRYDGIPVADIISRANVGRSTFYEHYKSKDDMLIHSMSSMLGILADAAGENPNQAALERVATHFLDARQFCREILWGQAASNVALRIARELAVRIEAHVELRLRNQRATALIPVRLVATQVAAAQLALVRAWLSDETGCSPGQLALALRQSAMGSIAALVPAATNRTAP